MPSTTFYTSHLLPSRPAHTAPPSSPPVDIKHSSHKSLTAFLRAAEKAGLLTLKSVRGELLVARVAPTTHPAVAAHRLHASVRDAEERRVRRDERAAGMESSQAGEMRVVEKWRPHLGSVAFFREMGKEFAFFFFLFLLTLRCAN
jgi:translation initiation factor 2D